MKLYFLATNVVNLISLEYNLTILLRLLFPTFSKLVTRGVDNYYLITPYKKNEVLFNSMNLPLPPLSILSRGVLSMDANDELTSLFAFEFLGRKLYIVDRSEITIYDIFYTTFSSPLSGPEFDSMHSATLAINGRIPIYTIYSKHSMGSILHAYNKVLIDNPYMVSDVSSIRKILPGVYHIPFLNEDKKNTFVSSFKHIPMFETPMDLITSIAARRSIPGYYFDGILYTTEKPIIQNVEELKTEIMDSLRNCHSGLELTSLSTIAELTTEERANTIMLSDTSCVNINPESLEYFLRRPFSLRTNLPLAEIDELDIAVHDASIMGYYPLRIGDTVFTTGFSEAYFPTVDLEENIEFRGRTLYVENSMIGTASRILTNEEIKIISSKLDKMLSSYAKAYLYEYKVIPEYLLGNRTVSRYLFSNVDSLISYLQAV